MNGGRIYIVEDDPHIALGLEELLKGEGCEVARSERGDEAMEAAIAFRPDLMVLDVMLPGRNGFDLCRAIRKRGLGFPILMLTAKGQELDKVLGLELGADDYLTKPFGVREFLARVQALLRRAGGAAVEAPDSRDFAIGSARICPKSYQLELAGEIVDLTAKELRLLQLFYRNAGAVMTRDRLLNEVWGYDYTGNTRTLDQVIVRLRRLIGEPPGKPAHLVTVHGVGYKLNLSPSR